MKILNRDRCEAIEHGNLDLYIDNLNKLLSWTDVNGNKKPVVIRIPVIGSYTSTDDNRKLVYNLRR